MKRLIASVALCLSFVLVLIGTLHTVHAEESTDPCAALTAENFHSDACNAAIAANPVPDFVRPVTYNPDTDGRSRPRSILLPEKLPAYPIGWVLKEWYYSDKPGADLVVAKDRFYDRGQLILVYASVKVRNFDWLLIGPDRWIMDEYIAVLHIPQRPEKVSGHWITLDLSEETLVASIDDKPVFATLISAGWTGGYGFTHVGLYNIYARARFTTFRGPPWAKVPEYIIDHVPYVMFFDKDVALHGAYWHNYFGFERSHGCVNIPVGDEAWLWNFVNETVDQWGPDTGAFFLAHPDKTPFVYVYRSAKLKTS
ncbi:MAG: L,D-transpeptidase [Chloroflexota bacterium]